MPQPGVEPGLHSAHHNTVIPSKELHLNKCKYKEKKQKIKSNSKIRLDLTFLVIFILRIQGGVPVRAGGWLHGYIFELWQ